MLGYFGFSIFSPIEYSLEKGLPRWRLGGVKNHQVICITVTLQLLYLQGCSQSILRLRFCESANQSTNNRISNIVRKAAIRVPTCLQSS